jgi:glycolate oxidase FAD binding subunit
MQLITPASLDELSAALRDTTGVVSVRGSGARSRWGGVVADPDVVVDLTGMSGVVEHALGDLVVTVEAGALLDDLQGCVGEHGQWLALDPPAGGSVGGLLATADSGPRRLRFGTPRDLLIGVTVVLADGTVARSGGKVVKNVAGYDLGKLFTGSYGTLGVIATATFRLHPVLPARRVVAVETTAPWAAARQVLRCPATPTAIGYDGTSLQVLIESSQAAVDAQADAVAALIGGITTADPPRGFGTLLERDTDEMLLKLTFRVSALDAVVAALRDAVDHARLYAHAGSGVMWATAPSDGAILDLIRRVTAAYDGAAVVVDAPDEVKRSLDVWGPVRGLDVMRRIKAQFDPGGRMNPGRFVGGI